MSYQRLISPVLTVCGELPALNITSVKVVCVVCVGAGGGLSTLKLPRAKGAMWPTNA